MAGRRIGAAARLLLLLACAHAFAAAVRPTVEDGAADEYGDAEWEEAADAAPVIDTADRRAEAAALALAAGRAAAAAADADALPPSPSPPTPAAAAPRIWTFENDPLPAALPSLGEWQRAVPAERREPPHELTSASFLPPAAPPRGYAAACLVARDGGADVAEWVHHHLRLGLWPVYLYDHASAPPLAGALRARIDAGDVVYAYFQGAGAHASGAPQLAAYDRCLAEHGAAHEWLAFLDSDEFLIFRDGPPVASLPAALRAFEGASALAVHWILFGSSGHATRPPGGALRSYVRCLPAAHSQHLFVKAIVRPACTPRAGPSPHAFVHNCSRGAVRTDGSDAPGPTVGPAPVYDLLAVHHYVTRSDAEFAVKVARGSGMRRRRGWEYFNFVDGWSTAFNFDAARVWDDDVSPPRAPQAPAELAAQLRRYAGDPADDFWARGGGAGAGAPARVAAADLAGAAADLAGTAGDFGGAAAERGAFDAGAGGAAQPALGTRQFEQEGDAPEDAAARGGLGEWEGEWEDEGGLEETFDDFDDDLDADVAVDGGGGDAEGGDADAAAADDGDRDADGAVEGEALEGADADYL